MPTLRERHLVHQPQRFEPGGERLCTRWTLQEKKKVLLGLRKFRSVNTAKIQAELLPHRSSREIDVFLQRMKVKSQTRPVIPKVKVPIELWCEMAEDLTQGCEDASSVLSEVFTKIEKCEVHDPKMTSESPDWRLIYNYLVRLLRGDELPDVGQIEAAVILDLLESLARHLRSLDITAQRRLMELKYQLLSTEVSPRDKQQIFDVAKRALDDDPLQVNTQSSSTAPSTASSRGRSLTASEAGPSSGTVVTVGSASDSNNHVDIDINQQSNEQNNVNNVNHQSQKFVFKPIKTPLFSINPFCIPVKYLNPKMASVVNGQVNTPVSTGS